MTRPCGYGMLQMGLKSAALRATVIGSVQWRSHQMAEPLSLAQDRLLVPIRHYGCGMWRMGLKSVALRAIASGSASQRSHQMAARSCLPHLIKHYGCGMLQR